MNAAPSNRGLLAVLLLALTLTSAMALRSWFTVGDNVRQSPLRIVTCTPDSYTPGDRQAECGRLYAGGPDFHSSLDPITVAGQVCNESDEPVVYQITVGWQAVAVDNSDLDNDRVIGATFIVIDTPQTVLPGCGEPYLFSFDTPEQLLLAIPGVSPGESLGHWRLVGRARPVQTSRYAPYQWDVTGTFTLVYEER